jgi:disulfide oxidoreductase YuzD
MTEEGLMPKEKNDPITWLPDVEDHDWPAAQSYLGLLHADGRLAEIMDRLRAAPLTRFKAKDIFRASRLSLLGVSNSHVEKDCEKIRKGQALSPLLLVRDETTRAVVIADGYHRLCAVYLFDEDAWIPCRIA